MTSTQPDRCRWLAPNLAMKRTGEADDLAGQRAVGACAGLEAA
jgi:hypothetical protein